MRKCAWLCLLWAVASTSAAEPVPPPGAVVLRVRFGMKDQEPTDWSGTIAVTPGRVLDIRGWRWTPADFAEGNAWTVQTRRLPPMDSVQRKRVEEGKITMPIGDNGVVITLADTQPSSDIEIAAKPGTVAFKLSEIPYGQRLQRLEGNLEIERAPAVMPIAQTDADEDCPSAVVGKDGTLYVAHVAFMRGQDFLKGRERVATPEQPNVAPWPNAPAPRIIAKPEDFDYLAQKTGGEQVWLRPCKNGAWGDPIAVTDAGGEFYKTALAVDGTGRVWVFYSAHLNADANGDHGNWESLARSVAPNGQLSPVVNISNAPGPDFAPAAATDADGKVWVTWMAGRGASFDIFAAQQSGDRFSTPLPIAATNANEWDPAIAADKRGNLAIAWDSYQKGDYDVYLALRGVGGKFGEPMPAAATLNFEVRPSLAYDGEGQLWVAWEQGDENWGKDFGPLKKQGIAIFQGRSLGVKVLRNRTEWLAPPEVMLAMPNLPRVGGRAGQGGKAAKSPPGKAQLQQAAPSFPRLATDAQGTVWLAFRGRPQGQWRVNAGPVFFEYVTRIEADQWMPSLWVPRSHNILDNRPALASLPGGIMGLIYSADGRGELHPFGPGSAGKAAKAHRAGVPDPNNHIFLAHIAAPDRLGPAKLEPIQADAPATPPPTVEIERQAVQAMRDYRVKLGGETLRLWRGEFHRHTEFSPDGGGDGAFMDMWRYGLDAAAMDWIGNGDHNNGNGREYSWWVIQKGVTLFTLAGRFVPMYTYERSVNYPEGHRNVVFARRGIRTLPNLPLSNPDLENPPPAPDTEFLYKYLRHFNGVCAEHTSATDMGTDWRNNDPVVEPFVEIYQGERNNYERPDSPRSAVTDAQIKNSTPEKVSFGGWRPKGFVNLALKKGYRLAFQSSSDHISTHMSYCNVWVTEPTRQAVLDGMKKRRVYAATDNIIADVRCAVDGKERFMGEEFTTKSLPTLNIKLIGALPLARVTLIKDDEVVHTVEPNKKEVSFTWADAKPTPGKTSYYYVRGEQVSDLEGATGEIVWVSPMWIRYAP